MKFKYKDSYTITQQVWFFPPNPAGFSRCCLWCHTNYPDLTHSSLRFRADCVNPPPHQKKYKHQLKTPLLITCVTLTWLRWSNSQGRILRCCRALWSDQLGNEQHQIEDHQKAPTMMDEPSTANNAKSLQQCGARPQWYSTARTKWGYRKRE